MSVVIVSIQLYLPAVIGSLLELKMSLLTDTMRRTLKL